MDSAGGDHSQTHTVLIPSLHSPSRRYAQGIFGMVAWGRTPVRSKTPPRNIASNQPSHRKRVRMTATTQAGMRQGNIWYPFSTVQSVYVWSASLQRRLQSQPIGLLMQAASKPLLLKYVIAPTSLYYAEPSSAISAQESRWVLQSAGTGVCLRLTAPTKGLHCL
jgi:hypothetical protein